METNNEYLSEVIRLASLEYSTDEIAHLLEMDQEEAEYFIQSCFEIGHDYEKAYSLGKQLVNSSIKAGLIEAAQKGNVLAAKELKEIDLQTRIDQIKREITDEG
jgi:argininosuccinate synthase